MVGGLVVVVVCAVLPPLLRLPLGAELLVAGSSAKMHTVGTRTVSATLPASLVTVPTAVFAWPVSKQWICASCHPGGDVDWVIA